MTIEDYALIGKLRPTARSRYREDTLIMETGFETDSGVARVIDFMAPRNGGSPQPMRIVEGLHGEVPMRMEFNTRPANGSLMPCVNTRSANGSLMSCAERTAERILALGDPNALRLSTPAQMRGDHRMILAEFNAWSAQAASRRHPSCRRTEVPSC